MSFKGGTHGVPNLFVIKPLVLRITIDIQSFCLFFYFISMVEVSESANVYQSKIEKHEKKQIYWICTMIFRTN